MTKILSFAAYLLQLQVKIIVTCRFELAARPTYHSGYEEDWRLKPPTLSKANRVAPMKFQNTNAALHGELQNSQGLVL